MENIPSKKENPNGLHQRYYIQKIVNNPDRDKGSSECILKQVDSDSEYFVMRLDNGGKDKIHVNACRKAVLHYAKLIGEYLPELSQDLINRYSNEV